MAKKEICEICGDEIYLEPEDTESHRGGTMGKMGVVEYEDGKPQYLCKEHLTL